MRSALRIEVDESTERSFCAKKQCNRIKKRRKRNEACSAAFLLQACSRICTENPTKTLGIKSRNWRQFTKMKKLPLTCGGTVDAAKSALYTKNSS